MSSSGFLKPQILVPVLILIALIGLSFGLKRQVDPKDKSSVAGETEFDRLETGPTRISRIDAPSAKVDSSRQSTANRAPARAKAKPREKIVENYETARKRADGDSYISGRIFHTPDNDDNERGRGRDGDNNTSGGERRRDDGDSWRDRFKPVETATIELYEDDPNTTHPPLRTALTDKEGSFTLANINAADQRYILVAKHTNFAPEATFVSMNEVPRDDVFMRLSEGVPVSGRVLDSETSEPIAGAIVYHPNPRFEAFSAMGVTTTTLSGEFSFPNVDSGSAITQARAEGYATTRARVRAPDDDTIIEMQAGGASIAGVTIDRLTGKPEGGARVWASGPRDIAESVISADDGTFTIKNLPEGEFKVYAVRGMKSEVQEIELARGEEIEDVEIILPTPLLVSGQVINNKDRQPLEGVKVWYQSTKGAQFRKTNSDGRFTFETMAIDEYAILIHEKGFLPVQEERTTAGKETIERKIAKNQSSDELVIRLKPVPTVEGNVLGPTRRGNAKQVIHDAEVKLAFVDGRNFHQLETKSDPAGNFFFNLPSGERGEGTIVAEKNYAMDAKDVRVPRKNPVQLNLDRDFMRGQLLLIDETPLDGVTVNVTTNVPKDRSGGSIHKMQMTSMNTMRGGMLFGALPKDQQVELTFSLPDGEAISKEFNTNRLLNSRPIFVYDPVSKDIVADTTPRQRNRDWDRYGERGRGDGGGRGGQNGGQGQGGGRRGGDGQGGQNGQGGPQTASDGAGNQGGQNRQQQQQQ